MEFGTQVGHTARDLERLEYLFVSKPLPFVQGRGRIDLPCSPLSGERFLSDWSDPVENSGHDADNDGGEHEGEGPPQSG